MANIPGVDVTEARFLSECLKAGLVKTSVPCGLLLRKDRCGVEEDFFPRTTLYGSTTSTDTTAFSDTSPFEDKMSWPVHLDTLPMGNELHELVEAKFDSWGFDVFTLSRLGAGRPLQLVGWQALRRSSCTAQLDLHMEKVEGFLQKAETSYKPGRIVPYHNNLHAADVTHAVHALLHVLGLARLFDAISSLALILGAIVHDLGHDGHNNAFHINVQDDLALTYNDQSVLENYHIAQAFKLLFNCPDTNVLQSLSSDELSRARKEIIENVLGTDMAHHFRCVSNFKGCVEKYQSDQHRWVGNRSAMSCLGVMLLHTADISNPAKPIYLSDQWTGLLKEEFYMQGDEERLLGLPISPICDSGSNSFASSQVGFIRFIVRPSFDLLHEQAGIKEGSNILSLITENLFTWEDRKRQEERLQKLAV